MSTIQSEHFVKALLILLEESFTHVYGIYLDKGTSLFETLAEISAEEASVPVGGKCATLAAQVQHIAFYLDVVEKSVKDPNYPAVDWMDIWNNVKVVDDSEWQKIQDELRQIYASIQELLKTTPAWPSEREVGGAIGVIAHTAYHLGEIRQALCTLRQ
ncbi:MAG: hypothetical protein RBT01_15435 [Anaerolineaceae bacterium]|jgi:hypothetical protein|nr:hypothetical protein [Anaerolineaceae bacterium]